MRRLVTCYIDMYNKFVEKSIYFYIKFIKDKNGTY